MSNKHLALLVASRQTAVSTALSVAKTLGVILDQKMKRHIIFILTTVTTFTSCDNMIQKVNQQVENSIKTSKMVMDSDVVSAKETFSETYEKVLQSTTDSSVSRKIVDLYSKINGTSNYIDSLKLEMNKLDDKDLQSSTLVKKIFLNDGIGDSVFNKVKLSYTQAIDIALTDTAKSRLKKVQDIYTTETKKQFFEMNGPLGANMILYGIQSELIKDGTRSLYGYKTK